MKVMKIPRLRMPKIVRSKLSAAKLLGGVMKNSLQFKLRRGAFAKRYKTHDFDTIIVDMDGTIYRTDANVEALSIFYPERTEDNRTYGEEIYDSILAKIASGQYGIEQGIVEGNKFLMAKKVRLEDFSLVLERVTKTLRKPLIAALKKLKQKGKTIVLATLSSKNFGEMLNSYIAEKYGFSFDYVLGTELEFDPSGQIIGVKSIVGTKDYDYAGILVKTKLSALRDAMQKEGKTLDARKTLLITDSYGDIDLAKMLVTILIKPQKPTAAQKVSQRLGLADYILPDDSNLRTNLESIVLGPKK